MRSKAEIERALLLLTNSGNRLLAMDGADDAFITCSAMRTVFLWILKRETCHVASFTFLLEMFKREEERLAAIAKASRN